MTKDELRSNPFFWSRLGFCYDPPRYDKNGDQIIFSKDYDYYRKTHDDFRDAGVMYHTTILHSGWVDDNQYDYRLTDEILHALLDNNPDIKYMPRVKLNAPIGWCKNHPEDVCVYYNGPRTAEEIAALIDTPKHDIIGFESSGYGVNGGKGIYKDDRPNFGGLVALQSFSSEQWRKDAGEALRRLIRHIAEGPFAKQIIGYHVPYGMCGETSLWGGWGRRQLERRGDYGINNRKNYIAYGLKKYGSEAALLKKWQYNSIDEIQIPSPTEIELERKTLRDLFFDEKQSLRCADLLEFHSDSNVKSVESYCKIVKEELGDDAVAGAFYGYMYIPDACNTGHLAIDRMLESPYVDFVASPKGYHRCMPGDPGGEQGPSQSMNRKLAWLDEIDNHTHLDRREKGRAANPMESETVLVREAVKNLSQAQGFWWMDLGEGWFDTPELMDLIRRLTDTERRMIQIPHRSVSEVLLVVDDEVKKNMSLAYGLSGGLLYELQSECRLIGTALDTYRLNDLEEIDLSQYKLIVFANCFRFREGQFDRIMKRIPATASLVWHYAAGILNPNFDVENVRKVTGFGIEEFQCDAPLGSFGYQYNEVEFNANPEGVLLRDFPMVCVKEEPSVTVWARYPDGRIMTAEKERNSQAKTYLCTFPSLMAADIRKMAEDAGCQMNAPVNCTVYADNRIFGVFPKEALKGTVMLPAGCTENGQTKLDVDIPAHGSLWFLLDEAK